MKTLQPVTWKDHFFRKGDTVRVMYNKELKDLGYLPYFNEDGDLMDKELNNIILTAIEVDYVGELAKVVSGNYDYGVLIKYPDGYQTYIDVFYLAYEG